MRSLRLGSRHTSGELDKVLGLGLGNPQREVGAGDFSIDLVAETNFGDVVSKTSSDEVTTAISVGW